MSDRNNIQTELKELSSSVFEKTNQGKGGFSVPTDYFDSLRERVMTSVMDEMPIHEELERLSPFVSDLFQNAKGGFKKPSLNLEQLLAEAKKEEKTPQPQAKVRKLGNSKIMAVAASIMLLVVAGFWMMNGEAEVMETNPMAQFASFGEEDVLEYLDENIAEFALDDLYESGLVADSDLGYNTSWEDLTEEEAYSLLEMSLEEDTEYEDL